MGALRPGYEVTSEIRLVRRLGAGGMGTVWVARHDKLQCDVVVKFLSESLTSDADACARFSREVIATVQVRSPHVVQTLDHGVTEGGIPYIVMELLEGEDLAKVLRARKYLRPDEVQHVIEGVAAALAKAHERGIVHRDIKPANVFMCTGSPRPFVKLVDFGIAKRLEDETMTATNALLGTPAYMSPEQMGGTREIDHRSDLWALAVLAFHCLTGSPPFRGAHVAGIAHSIFNEATPRATATRPELPPAIDAWMERALAREPDDRFSSAREMADTLALALGDQAYLTTNRLLAMGSNPFAKPARPPPPPPSIPTGPVLGLPPSTGFDGVGATLGPSAITHSPYMSSPQLKWWVMGGAALAVVLIGGAFRVGYGLRHEEQPAFPPAPAAPPPQVVIDSPAPTMTAPPATPPVPMPVPIVIAPPSASAPAAPATAETSARPASPTAVPSPRKPPRAAGTKKSGRPDEDDVGF